jgi:serine/threonine protein phosphatase 1
MGRIIAIGDVHGCFKTVEKVLSEDLGIRKEDEIYFMGDYIDRGKNSKGVIELIFNLRTNGYSIHTLRGNHEQMLLDSIADSSKLPIWLRNGGVATLKSFGISSLNELDDEYLKFFEDTQLYIELPGYIFVHAGLNFNQPDIFSDTHAMLWARNFTSDQPSLGTRIMVYGHTPKPLNDILTQSGNCLNIDGGCVYDDYPGLGYLVALDVHAKKFYYRRNED